MLVGHLAREPIHPREQGGTKPKRLQHPDGAQAGHPEWAGHRLLPHPPRSPSQAARRRAAETSTATQLQFSKLLTYRAVQNMQRKRKRAPPGDCHPPARAPGWVPTHCSASSRAPLPAGMGMREAKHSPPPAEGEQGAGIHLSLLHPSSRDLQEEPGDPPEAAATPLLGGWMGAATTPRLPPRQPDLQPGVKVGPASRGWRHWPCLPRADRGKVCWLATNRSGTVAPGKLLAPPQPTLAALTRYL